MRKLWRKPALKRQSHARRLWNAPLREKVERHQLLTPSRNKTIAIIHGQHSSSQSIMHSDRDVVDTSNKLTNHSVTSGAENLTHSPTQQLLQFAGYETLGSSELAGWGSCIERGRLRSSVWSPSRRCGLIRKRTLWHEMPGNLRMSNVP